MRQQIRRFETVAGLAPPPAATIRRMSVSSNPSAQSVEQEEDKKKEGVFYWMSERQLRASVEARVRVRRCWLRRRLMHLHHPRLPIPAGTTAMISACVAV